MAAHRRPLSMTRGFWKLTTSISNISFSKTFIILYSSADMHHLIEIEVDSLPVIWLVWFLKQILKYHKTSHFPAHLRTGVTTVACSAECWLTCINRISGLGIQHCHPDTCNHYLYPEGNWRHFFRQNVDDTILFLRLWYGSKLSLRTSNLIL